MCSECATAIVASSQGETNFTGTWKTVPGRKIITCLLLAPPSCIWDPAVPYCPWQALRLSAGTSCSASLSWRMKMGKRNPRKDGLCVGDSQTCPQGSSTLAYLWFGDTLRLASRSRVEGWWEGNTLASSHFPSLHVPSWHTQEIAAHDNLHIKEED